MYLETLFDHLAYHGITKKEACILFGRTSKTLKRWNEEPPDWVIRIVQLMGKKPAFPDQWKDWYFDREWIVDPAGNAFHIDDVRNLWIERQVTRSIRGDKADIYSLKMELEKRINVIESEIKITVDIGNVRKSFDIAL